jgi:hypothetical protein
MTLPMLLEFLSDRSQRMFPPQRLDGPIRPHHQQPRRATPTRHVGEPIEGRDVTPVQILQDDDQRPFHGEDFHSLGQLSQHTHRCHSIRQALERAAFSGRQQRRHLHQPARGMLAEHGEKGFPVRSQAEPPQGFQQGQVGFPHPVRLEALAVTHPWPFVEAQTVHKRFDQRRFTDAGPARHEAHLPRALARQAPPLVEPGQLCLPTHER